MDEMVAKELKRMYEIDYDIPHRAFQFPRLPPGINPPMFKIFENPGKDSFLQNAGNLQKNLDEYQTFFQQYASKLTTSDSARIVPPGHPLYSEKNSVKILKAENDKLVKQNLELKKKLEEKSK